MTIVAVRDGVLAVDSYIGSGRAGNGRMVKWARVHERHGGGFVACAGDAAPGQQFIRSFESSADPMERPAEGADIAAIWLRADGSVREWSIGWLEYEAEFYAIGSGTAEALGAMAAGATAEQAAYIACRFRGDCGGDISVLKVG